MAVLKTLFKWILLTILALLGHLGQRVLVLPKENAIIVRLGKKKGLSTPVEGFHLEPDLGQYVTEVKAILDGLPELSSESWIVE